MKKSKIPEKISFVMGSLPVIYSEDRIMYWNFYEAIVDTLRPDDVHEFMLVETIANCDWEIIRYKRAKARIIDLRFQEALANVLRPIIEEGTIIISRDKDAAQLAQDWFRDKETKKAIQDHLFDYGLDEEGVVAEAMRLCMNDLADLEQLVHSNERRRSLAYRDLQFWRETKPSRQALELKALPSM